MEAKLFVDIFSLLFSSSKNIFINLTISASVNGCNTISERFISAAISFAELI